MAGRARRHELSRALVQRCARESPHVWPISSPQALKERHVDVGMRWRCSRRQPIAAALADLLGVFSAFSRRGPPSDPDIAPSKRCSHHERYTRLHGRPSNGGAYMFCMLRLTSLAVPSLSAALPPCPPPARESGTCAIRQHAPCIDCRPAQPLCRVSPIVTRPAVFVRHEARARVDTRDAPAGPLDPKVKAHTTRRSRELSLTAVLLHAAGLAGPASVIKPTQQR